MQFKRTLLASLCVLGSLAALGGAAQAGPSGTTSTACGWTDNAANIPAGAIGVSRADGPVKAILDAVGEYRTHSFISHGNGWYTHSTMYTPGRPGWPDYCSTPLTPSQLQNGYPGASQVNDAALYTFYHQPGASLEAIYYQRSPDNGAGNTIQAWLWSTAPFAWVGSLQDGGAGFYRIGFLGITAYTQYSLYQYRDMQGIANGDGNTYDYGDVCSTYLAYAQNRAGFGTVSNNNTYDHGKVATGLNALWNSVNDECHASMGFWPSVGSTLTCFDSDLCDEAADQVSNCFSDGADGRCYTSDSKYWHAVRDSAGAPGPKDANGYAVSTAISPDAISGWSGHGFGTAAPNPVWSWDGNNAVYWNAPGRTYGCFF